MIEKQPLYKLSSDKTNERIVCNYKNKFINFDNLKGILKKKKIPESPDMLYINNDKKEIWFVEFKSSKKDNLDKIKEKIKLKRKFFAGIFLIYEIFCKKSCDYKKYKKYYFIVFNKKNENYENELINIFEQNNTRDIEFGLADLKPTFVNDVITDNCENFIKLFSQRFQIKFEENLN